MEKETFISKNRWYQEDRELGAMVEIQKTCRSTIIFPIKEHHIETDNNRLMKCIHPLNKAIPSDCPDYEKVFHAIIYGSQEDIYGSFAWSIMLGDGTIHQRGQQRLPPSTQMNILYAELAPILEVMRIIPNQLHSMLKFYTDNIEVAKRSCRTVLSNKDYTSNCSHIKQEIINKFSVFLYIKHIKKYLDTNKLVQLSPILQEIHIEHKQVDMNSKVKVNSTSPTFIHPSTTVFIEDEYLVGHIRSSIRYILSRNFLQHQLYSKQFHVSKKMLDARSDAILLVPKSIKSRAIKFFNGQIHVNWISRECPRCSEQETWYHWIYCNSVLFMEDITLLLKSQTLKLDRTTKEYIYNLLRPNAAFLNPKSISNNMLL